MPTPCPMLYEATTESQVVEAVRAYLARLPPIAHAAFPGGAPRPPANGDDVAELALALARERSGRFGSPWAAMTLQPVEAFLSRACTRLAQLEAGTRQARPHEPVRSGA